jgi:hypothetical protein
MLGCAEDDINAHAKKFGGSAYVKFR